MSTFDPYSSTLDEAQAQPDAYAIPGPVWRWIGAHGLKRCRSFYEDNAMHGMAQCAIYDLSPPAWLAMAFLRSYRTAALYRVRTWDQAFGAPHPKGKNLALARQAFEGRLRVAQALTAAILADPTRPVDKGLWEDIGAAVGLGATRAQELYREARQIGLVSDPAAIRRCVGNSASKPARKRKPAGLLGKA